MPANKPAKDQSQPEPRLSRGRTRDDARFTAVPSLAALPESYAATLQEIKTHLRGARVPGGLALHEYANVFPRPESHDVSEAEPSALDLRAARFN